MKQGTSRKTTFYCRNRPSILQKICAGQTHFQKRYRREGLSEEAVFKEINLHSSCLKGLPPHLTTIFHYALTEMVNNAIDHSQSNWVRVIVGSSSAAIHFSVMDSGVGIFENIRAKKRLGSEMEALQDLLKGKQTTAPTHHSGEGVFFTSKIADRFIIQSHKKELLVDNQIDDLFVTTKRNKVGTFVYFELQRTSQRRLEEIFHQYTGENFRFDTSQVAVKLFSEGEEYISRSQAKRLIHSLEVFEKITLDFKGVKVVGQGFADEVFRVFLLQHPNIKIIPINCSEDVQFMINRAKNSSESLTN
ncbi:MAG: DUF4325 domain-containing protein [Deltaproteobacteria bacterium]|nr:DUF4325 domain-containing protein [Deltaproteobacteria bacterium]